MAAKETNLDPTDLAPHMAGEAIDIVKRVAHAAAVQAGWWHRVTHNEARPMTDDEKQQIVGDKLLLIVSEICEGNEARRKDLMDDHLPEFDGLTVELADAVIRIADLAGALNLPLGKALAAKMEYNARRVDHTLAARIAPGGKKF